MYTSQLSRLLAAAATAAVLAMPAAASAQDAPGAPSPKAKAEQQAKSVASKKPQIVVNAKRGQYIVTVRGGANPRRVARSVGARPTHVYHRVINGFAARLSSSQLRRLRRDHRVKAVEAVVRGGVTATESMDSGDNPWGLDRIDARSGLDYRYNYGWTGAGVRVYVIDTGINVTLPEFGGRAQMVYDTFGGNGADCFGHGTHVSGTIGGATYGVAKNVLLRGMKVLDCTGHYDPRNLITALDWLATHAVKPAVLNMSIGGPRDPAVNAATTRLTQLGISVVVSAGNDNTDACTQSPASAYGTLTVAASDRNDSRWVDTATHGSNYGQCVDAYAPGAGIASVLNDSRGVQQWYGTSMAAPHVSGMIAIAKQAFGDRDPAVWVQWVKSNATPNVIRNNPAGTPNLLVWKGTL